MGGLFGSITIPGNRLTDLVGQTSTVGRPIPRGWGKVRVEEPNVIWTAGIPKEHVKKKKQGKGGVKTEEYTYTLSYAIAFMRGPVFGFITIKRGGKVVYTTDPNAPVEDKAYAAKWLRKAKLYLGTETQMPDATIESYVGAGKVSAFRGLCYIVLTDDDVTGESGAVPQYEAVITATSVAYLSTPPYVLEDVVDTAVRATPARIQVPSPPQEFSSAIASSRPVEIEVRGMRSEQASLQGSLDAGAQPVSIEVQSMRVEESLYMGQQAVSSRPVSVEVKQTRFVLDKMQETKSKNSAKPISIEVVAP